MLKSLSILSRFNHQYAASVNDLASHKHCGKGSGEFGEPQAVDNASETLSVYCNVFIYTIKTFSPFCIIIIITYYRLFFSLFFKVFFAFIILS